MSTQPNNEASNPATEQSHETETRPFYRRGRILGGIIVIGVGVVLLASNMGANFPDWFFHWGMIPIVIGLYAGARRKFRSFGWLIPVAIGTLFLLHDFADLPVKLYIAPVVLILVGFSIIFKDRNRRCERRRERWARRSDRYTAA